MVGLIIRLTFNLDNNEKDSATGFLKDCLTNNNNHVMIDPKQIPKHKSLGHLKETKMGR